METRDEGWLVRQLIGMLHEENGCVCECFCVSCRMENVKCQMLLLS